MQAALGIAHDNIIWSELDDEVILLDTSSGNFYSLNGTATEVWQGLEHGDSLDQVAAGLASKYGVDQTLAHADVMELITELRTMGLLS